MTAAFAGAFARRSGAPAADELRRAIDPEGAATVRELGRLAVAFTDAAHAADGPPFRLLAGALEEPSALDVAARALTREGVAAASALRGAFALLAWDPERETGALVRDPLGARPVFYAERGDVLLFAGEIRVLLRLLSATPAPDEVAAVQWLVDGTCHPESTLFAGIRRLPAGHALVLDGAGWSTAATWQPTPGPTLDVDRREVPGLLSQAIDDAVRPRDDGPAGVLLSGGLDSSAVAVSATRTFAARDLPVGAFSQVFPSDPATDESEFITATARQLDIPLVALEVTETGPFAASAEYLREWRVPNPTPNLAPQLHLLRHAASNGTAVMLDGEGGDELFGLAPYLLADELRRGRVRRVLRLARGFPGAARYPLRPVLGATLPTFAFRGLLPHRIHLAAWRRNALDVHGQAWLRPGPGRRWADASDPWGWKRRRGPLWWRHLAEQLTIDRERMGVHEFLSRREHMTGLSGRSPLVHDVPLVELALRTPPAYKFDGRANRPLLREALRGQVPDAVRLRTIKSDFSSLFRRALEADWSAAQRLLGPDSLIGGLVDLPYVRERILAAPESERPFSWHWDLWRILALEMWLRSLADAAFPDELLDRWELRAPALAVLAR